MMKRISAFSAGLLFSFLLWMPGGAFAQAVAPSQLQALVQEAIKKSYPACVYITKYDPVRQRPVAGRFSGVVVSSDGIILTAGHAASPDSSYQVQFPDGRKVVATGLGRIRRLDVAMLKISDPGTYPAAEMGWSSSLKRNEPCVSIAYPGSFAPERMVVRFGYVAEPFIERRNQFRSTCLMEPGDSGGPVFDLFGRVIGIHSNITLPLENNYEVPVDFFRKYWTALLEPVNYRELPPEDMVPADPLADRKVAYASLQAVPDSLEKKEREMSRYCTLIRSRSKSDTAVTEAVGTLFLPAPEWIDKIPGGKNSILMVSKSSIVGDMPEVRAGKNKWRQVSVLSRDPKRDLVLMVMKADKRRGSALPFAHTGDALNPDDLGDLLLSPHPSHEGELSVLGTTEFAMLRNSSSGYLGLSAEEKAGKTMIMMVQPGSAAGEAMIRAGDELLSINEVSIKSSDDLIDEMRLTKPGDSIVMVLNRQGRLDTVRVQLGKRPVITSPHIAEKFTDGKSERRDGFGEVFVHDSKLKPAECGGPVFNLEGRFLGINIARYSRTSSLVIPAAEVESFIGTSFKRSSLF